MASSKKREDRSSTGGSLPSLGEILTGRPCPPSPEKKVSLPDGAQAEEAKGSRKEPSPMAGAVLRRSRKGRGGHVVTLVETRGLVCSQEDLARKMARALGCGSRLEEGQIVLQGDQIDRAEEWLKKQGKIRIVRGS